MIQQQLVKLSELINLQNQYRVGGKTSIMFSSQKKQISKQRRMKVSCIITDQKTSLRLKTQNNYIRNTFILQNNLKIHQIFQTFSQNIQYNKKKCQDLIKIGANVNTYNQNGLTPLHLAVIKNEYQAIRYGLENKRDLFDIYKGTQNEGKNIFHLSINFGRTQIVRLLLQNEYDIDIKDKFGNTGLNIINEYIRIRKLINKYKKQFNRKYLIKGNVYASGYKGSIDLKIKTNSYKKLIDKLCLLNNSKKQIFRTDLYTDLQQINENNKKVLFRGDIDKKRIQKKIKHNLILYYQASIQF